MPQSAPGRIAGYCRAYRCARLVALVIGFCIAISSTAQNPATRDLTQFSLEDLMNVQVTSVSKKKHAEFPDFQLIDHVLDQRSIFGKITWRF